MNCAEARRALRAGARSSDDAREAALAHLDGCPSCRSEASQIDPLLALRRLPEIEVDASEVAEMQQAVARLRRTSPVAGRRYGGRWAWAAAAAAMALGLLLQPGARDGRTAVRRAVELTPSAATVPEAVETAFVPSVETLGPAPAYVATQVAEEDLTLVILANVDVGGR